MPYSPMELAEAFLKTGELHDALDALNQQLETDPQDHYARTLRIQVCLRLDTSELLQLAAQDAQSLNQSADDYLLASIVQERLGNYQAALLAVQSARELEPENTRLIGREVDLLIHAKDYDVALQRVQQQPRTWQWLEREADLLVLRGDDITATARYGLVLAQLEDGSVAIQLDHLQALRARVLLARAHAYRRLHHLDQAREHYLAAQKLLPDDPTISFNLGIIDWLDNQFEAAITRCKTAYQQAPAALQDEMLASIQADGFALLRGALSNP